MLVLLGTLLLVSVAGLAAADEPREFVMDIEYVEFGIAPQPPRAGFVRLKPGTEKEVATWAIVQGLMRLGNVVENVALDTILEPRREWITGIGHLGESIVADYNQAVSAASLRLPRDRLFGVRYSGEYLIVNDQLRFLIRSVLYQRGMGTDYIDYKVGGYDDGFFFNRAQNAISSALRDLTNEAERHPESRKP